MRGAFCLQKITRNRAFWKLKFTFQYITHGRQTLIAAILIGEKFAEGVSQSSFQNSQEANACKWSISSPFFTAAPCALPRRKNSVSRGLYTRSYSKCSGVSDA